MTQEEKALQLFEEHSGVISLGEILNTNLAAEYRRLFTNMRQKGYHIECIQSKIKSDNKYFLLKIPHNSNYSGCLADEKIFKYYGGITDKRKLIEDYELVKNTYPFNHPQVSKIDKQINKMKNSLNT